MEQHRRPGTLELVLHGELDVATAPRVDAALAALRDDERELRVDLSDLAFLDSTGLRTLLRASRVAQERGGRLAMVPGPSAVQRVFELTGLVDQFAWVEP